MKKGSLSEFTKFVFYSIIGAIIFLLIYSIWFNPSAVTTFYEDTKETITKKVSNINLNSSKNPDIPPTPTRARIVPSEMTEYAYFKSVYQSCAAVEVAGESNGIYDMKKKVCREACGKRNMEYDSNDCEIDLLVCYCEL